MSVEWDMLVEMLRSTEVTIEKRIKLAEEHLDMINKQRDALIAYIKRNKE